MEYVSTRGGAPLLSFEDIVLSGVAPDGGLYVPLFYPRFSQAEWAKLAGASYEEVVFAVVSKFSGKTFSSQELIELIAEAYAPFRHRAIAPLKQLASGMWLLELFHGPTWAFKDFALRLLAQMVARLLSRKGDKKITLIGATSGDTGSAALAAFRDVKQASVFILHPKGRVSPIQRLQMTTFSEPHLHALAIEGDFDDTQRIVKELFGDSDFVKKMGLVGVNSLNWVRILAQVAYYVYASLSLGQKEIEFTVPTGNFGNVFAGYVARLIGAPIRRLGIATNVNDLLHRTLATGVYASKTTVPSSSPSMDIQVSSNFERALFEFSGRDSALVSGLMATFAKEKSFTLPSALHTLLSGVFFSGKRTEEQTRQTILDVFEKTGEILDPHTAVGYGVALEEARSGTPMVTLATAHPAKFREALSACGFSVSLPKDLAALEEKKEKYETLPSESRAVRVWLEQNML